MKAWLRLLHRVAVVLAVSLLFAACQEQLLNRQWSALGREPIPNTLNDALDTLDRAAPVEVLTTMKNGEESVVDELPEVLLLGQWIRQSWGISSGGLLYQSLAVHGPLVADLWPDVLLHAWWNRLHGRPLGVTAMRLHHPPQPPERDSNQ